MYKVRLIVQVNDEFPRFMNNVLHAANNCNVTSTVIPTDDSKFVIEAQGHDKQINSFVDWCNDNPYGGKLTEYTIVSYKKQN